MDSLTKTKNAQGKRSRIPKSHTNGTSPMKQSREKKKKSSDDNNNNMPQPHTEMHAHDRVDRRRLSQTRGTGRMHVINLTEQITDRFEVGTVFFATFHFKRCECKVSRINHRLRNILVDYFPYDEKEFQCFTFDEINSNTSIVLKHVVDDDDDEDDDPVKLEFKLRKASRLEFEDRKRRLVIAKFMYRWIAVRKCNKLRRERQYQNSYWRKHESSSRIDKKINLALSLAQVMTYLKFSKYLSPNRFETVDLVQTLVNVAAELVAAAATLSSYADTVSIKLLMSSSELDYFQKIPSSDCAISQKINAAKDSPVDFSPLNYLSDAMGALLSPYLVTVGYLSTECNNFKSGLHPSRQYRPDLSTSKTQIMAIPSLQPIIRLFSSLCLPLKGETTGYRNRCDHLPVVFQQLHNLTNPSNTQAPFGPEIARILMDKLSKAEWERLSDINPLLFGCRLTAVKTCKQVSHEVSTSLNLPRQPNEEVGVVVHGADNFGTRFGAEYVETITSWVAQYKKDVIPTEVKQRLASCPHLMTNSCDLSATGLEPHPDNFFGSKEAHQCHATMNNHYVVACSNVQVRQQDRNDIKRIKIQNVSADTSLSHKIKTDDMSNKRKGGDTFSEGVGGLSVFRREVELQAQLFGKFSTSVELSKLQVVSHDIRQQLNPKNEILLVNAGDGAPSVWNNNLQRSTQGEKYQLALQGRLSPKDFKETPLVAKMKKYKLNSMTHEEKVACIIEAITRDMEEKEKLANLSQSHETASGEHTTDVDWFAARGFSVGGSSIGDFVQVRVPNKLPGPCNSVIRSFLCSKNGDSNGFMANRGHEMESKGVDAGVEWAKLKHPGDDITAGFFGVVLSTRSPTQHASVDGVIYVQKKDGPKVPTYLIEVKAPCSHRYLLDKNNDFDTSELKHGPIQHPVYGLNKIEGVVWNGERLIGDVIYNTSDNNYTKDPNEEARLTSLFPCPRSHFCQMQHGLLVMNDWFKLKGIKSNMLSCVYVLYMPKECGGCQIYEVPYNEAYALQQMKECEELYYNVIPEALSYYQVNNGDIKPFLKDRVAASKSIHVPSNQEKDIDVVNDGHDDDGDDDEEFIEDDGDMSASVELEDLAKAIVSRSKHIAWTGEFHMVQAAVESVYAVFGDELKAIALLADPKITSDNRADFLISNGSMNQSIHYLLNGCLVAFNRYKVEQYYLANPSDRRPVEESVFDVEKWFSELGKEIKVLARIGELTYWLTIVCCMWHFQDAGGMFYVTQLFRDLLLPLFYATSRNTYARMVVDDKLKVATLPREDLMYLHRAVSVHCGTHVLSVDKFTEEIHRIYKCEVSSDHKNKDTWLKHILNKSTNGPLENGLLGNLGSRTASDVAGHAPFGSLTMDAEVVDGLRKLLNKMFDEPLSIECKHFRAFNGETYCVDDNVGLNGNRCSEFGGDIRRLGLGIGWPDVGEIVYGCPKESFLSTEKAGAEDVQVENAEFKVTLSRQRKALPTMCFSSLAQQKQKDLLLMQSTSLLPEDIHESFKLKKRLLVSFIVRYEQNAEILGLAHDDELIYKKIKTSANVKTVEKRAFQWRSEHQEYCKKLDMVDGVPCPPVQLGEVLTADETIKQQVDRHAPSWKDRIAAQDAIRGRWKHQFLVKSHGPPKFNIDEEQEGGDVIIQRPWESLKSKSNPQPHQEPSVNTFGGQNNAYLREDWRSIRLLVNKFPSHRDCVHHMDKQSEMHKLQSRHKRDMMYSLDLRDKNQECAEQTSIPSHWASGAPVPAVCIQESNRQLHIINGVEKDKKEVAKNSKYPCPYAGCGKVFARSAHLKAHQTERKHGVFTCLKKNAASNEVCNQVYGSKEELKAHQQTHRVWTCKARINEDGIKTTCQKKFYDEITFDLHKLMHKVRICDVCKSKGACNYEFANATLLKEHKKTEHTSRKTVAVTGAAASNISNIKKKGDSSSKRTKSKSAKSIKRAAATAAAANEAPDNNEEHTTATIPIPPVLPVAAPRSTRTRRVNLPARYLGNDILHRD